MQALGYTEHYYRTSFTEMSRGLPTSLESQLQPLYGSFEPTELLPMRWVQRSSSFAIYAPRGVNTLTLKIHNNISAVLEVLRVQGDSTEDWHVTANSDAGAASPLRLSRFSLTENVFGDWQIDLRGAEPIGHHGNWCLFKIDLETNFAFTPCFTFAESSDVRTMSFGLVDWRLDR